MGGAHFPGDDDVTRDAPLDGDVDPRDVGKLEHGCEHYRRRCKIVAPCCGQVFPCRHCHNEATVRLLFFFSVTRIEKGQYHCYDCGICRIGGKENFFHCVKCGIYTCPICSKTALDRSRHWEVLDQEIEATIMPPVYRYKCFCPRAKIVQIWVLCNDCNKVSEVNFHVLGHKCSHCNSYNTRSTSRPADSSGSSSDSSDNNL
ncbi:hypothetical protein PR202_ga12248 [Eleusine coracana subsp. coracana]|uniref:Uncharacterized protein n=1 Tax=Eleusine coracana subsp. coracana TaxID=191504 RepID=A0AAV5CBH8_ELECO|nr:hypothetical protein PR202_ga12248 [Eleusine coracana subsp. coracana]